MRSWLRYAEREADWDLGGGLGLQRREKEVKVGSVVFQVPSKSCRRMAKHWT